MNNVIRPDAWWQTQQPPPPSGPTEPPRMDLSERLGKVEATLPTLATKADLVESSSSIIKWIVGTALVISGTAVTVMTFVLNNATPKAPAAPQQPIVIYAPSAQPQPPAPPGSEKQEIKRPSMP